MHQFSVYLLLSLFFCSVFLSVLLSVLFSVHVLLSVLLSVSQCIYSNLLSVACSVQRNQTYMQ